MDTILGVSTTHDSGATLVQDGEIVAAVNEERFNRTKHYGYLPFESIRYCLDTAGITTADLDTVAVPSEVLRTDARLLLDADVDTTNVSQSSLSLLKKLTRESVETLRRASERNTRVPEYARTVTFPDTMSVSLVNHHEAHAATAYYCCGHDDALVVTLDGLGDRLSGTVWHGRDGHLENHKQWDRTGSLGWFFGVITQALGWWIGNGEGKTMGLASYADPDPDAKDELREILPRYEDGELADGHDFSRSASWEVHDTHHWSFEEEVDFVTGIIEEYGREETAAAAQELLEDQVVEIIGSWLDRTGVDVLATAGGVFLNVQVNQRILETFDLEDYFIFPNAGDGGLPTGAALSAHRHTSDNYRPFELNHPYLGPDITGSVPEVFEDRLLEYSRPDDIVERCADLLADGNIVAWCQGRMEYGPRALGNRSILIDPTRDDSMDRVNKRVKFRDSWRPFAPSIKEEAVEEYLVDPTYDPFMITSYAVREDRRDEIPAVTHVDGTTRPQVVRRSVNERYWRLIDRFGDRTGTPVLLNTSYNLSGDPIVCTPEDAIETFYNCGLDALAVGDYLLTKG
ncbi:carbamoyltransferase family protein [Halopenitus persicus]|uniref:Carbamoyltransferase n=1 Tax=Halopenitus persicus TaxID=1048396 RepID=A0A1H3J0G6_9EURY|nr:carbamoyltransferase C-terminal domain-containing protein [Halopenitus persicus]SDY33049.1 carbamoyltransferase [Halopenitus persicus]